jgi:drug/metabolite transporter (DMT)-like permease
MAFAAVLSVLLAILFRRPLAFSLHADYLWSLAYLAIFGSAVAFGCYLSLIRRIGASRAAYSSVLFPVVALGISTVFEGYRWTLVATLGIMLTLAGNWLILKRPRKPIPNSKTLKT